MTLEESNVAKIDELDPEIRWAGHALLAESRKLNLKFRISEARRTAERQYYYWQSGRAYPGPWKTDFDGYKKKSNHQLGLAIDIYPIGCTHFDIAQIAEQFGITHPFPRADPPHYEFIKVARHSYPPPALQLGPDQERRAFARGITRMGEGNAKERAAQRFFKKYGVSYSLALIP